MQGLANECVFGFYLNLAVKVGGRLRNLAAHKRHFPFLLRLTVKFLIVGPEHSNVHIEAEDLGLGVATFDFDCLFHGRHAANL